VVQDAADANDDEARATYAWARERLPGPNEAEPSTTKARGAMARTLAAIGEYEAAEEALSACVEEWRDQGAFEQSSYALSELLRIRGLLARNEVGASVDRVLSAVASAREFDVLPTLADQHQSRGYVRCAAARALVHARRHEDALELLSDVDMDWSRAGSAPQQQRIRWKARALAALGHVKEAAALRATVDEADILALVRLDAAVERGESGQSELEAVRGVEELVPELERLAKRYVKSPETLPRAFADEYRY
jgi:tetratricopeptide (TPR) repeat protein